MDFIDQIRDLSAKAQRRTGYVLSEEATKNALVMPFIQSLGYDVFNPQEVIPEFTADVGVKKGEKVDYAILKDGKPIILIECKKCGVDLDIEYANQLYRYFSVSQAKIAVLTDGIVYRFYTDLEETNKLDQKPFMEFDLLDIHESLVAELKKLTKSAFNLEEVLTVAEELKYTKGIKSILREQLKTPSEDFVRFFMAKVYSGMKTKDRMTKFAVITKNAFNQFITEYMNEKLKSAMAEETSPEGVANAEAITTEEAEAGLSEPTGRKARIVTTQEELEGYYIVKSILREVVDINRVYQRDTVSYFGILFDNNNRKPISRLQFNIPEKKWISIFDASKKEEKIPIDTLDDIYKYSDKLREIAAFYQGEAG